MANMTIDLALYVIVDRQFTGGRDPIAVAQAALLGGRAGSLASFGTT